MGSYIGTRATDSRPQYLPPETSSFYYFWGLLYGFLFGQPPSEYFDLSTRRRRHQPPGEDTKFNTPADRVKVQLNSSWRSLFAPATRQHTSRRTSASRQKRPLSHEQMQTDAGRRPLCAVEDKLVFRIQLVLPAGQTSSAHKPQSMSSSRT